MISGPVASSGEPVQGWRIWNLAIDEDGPSLRPAGAGVDAWSALHPTEARCGVPALLTLGRAPHRAPGPDCRCGIYAGSSLRTFERPRPAWPPPPVVGTVSLWGTVIEHERGWRAQLAYPSRLALVCAMCAWFEPGPGIPVVVHAFAGKVYPLCEVHRGGIAVPDGRRTRLVDLDPERVRSDLLDTYAVDPLPSESFGWLCRQPPTPEPPAFFPSIRAIPV